MAQVEQVRLQAAPGVAPVVTDSQTLNVNFNADLLDGMHGADFVLVSGFVEGVEDVIGAAVQATSPIVASYVDGTGITTLSFDQSVALNNNARLTVRKNTGADAGSRRRLNLIEGANITLTVADDPGSEEIDVTIAAAAGGAASLSEASVAFTDGDTVRRVTVVDAAVSATSKIVGTIRRPDLASDADDPGFIYLANVVRRQTGSFDLVVVCLDRSGDDTTPSPPNETVVFVYQVAA